MDINYLVYDYSEENFNQGIIDLYKTVFNVSIEKLSFLFEENPAGKPIGVIAIDKSNIVVGHFATMAIEARVCNQIISGRVSMGFMVKKEYQGLHIARNLADCLLKKLRELNNCDFVIGFPNDNSFYMHEKYMNYVHVCDFHMYKIPYDNNLKIDNSFTVIDSFCSDEKSLGYNMILHSADMLNWRFNDNAYIKYRDRYNNHYVCNTYKNTLQILYWSPTVDKATLNSFANYLYETNNIESVRTWNTYEWQNYSDTEPRAFHFTINVLNENMTDVLCNNWCFYPGDCELF